MVLNLVFFLAYCIMFKLDENLIVEVECKKMYMWLCGSLIVLYMWLYGSLIVLYMWVCGSLNVLRMYSETVSSIFMRHLP